GAEGQQADHGSNFQTLALAVGKLEHIVKKAVLLVPHPGVAAGVNGGGGDRSKMLKELERHVFVDFIVHRQFDGDLQHVEAEQGHPGSAVSLFEIAACGERRAAVEYADVVQAKKAAFESIFAGTVFAVQPPGEIEQQFLKAPLKPLDITPAGPGLFEPVSK